MANILIPTDFTSDSLQLAERALRTINLRNATIILFHAFDFPTSEFELLMNGKKKPYTDLMTDDFRQVCKQFKDQHNDSVQKICFKFMEGNNARVFRNFVEANEIDLIFCPDYYQYKSVHKLSVDPRPLFKKSGIKVIREFAPYQNRADNKADNILIPLYLTAE